jgi:hypothetical protein
MKSRLSRAAALALSYICLASPGVPPAAPQTVSSEYEVKAAFLYNFARFVDWPSQAFPGEENSPFTLCLAGDPFEGALDKILQGETLDRRPLTVRRMSADNDIHGCHILYVGPSEARRVPEILNNLGNAPILTVGETDDFIDNGGIVRFVKTGSRIHFQINPDAAQSASLKVSSRLLHLADIVRPRRRAGVTR